MKKCLRCGKEKPLASFYVRGDGSASAECRSCIFKYRDEIPKDAKRQRRNAWQSAYTKANRAKVNAARQARRADPEYAKREREKDRARHPDRWIRYHYGLTRERWLEILASQGGGCAICGRVDAGGLGGSDGFHVDHDHACCPGKKSCGKCVRGLLCNHCNPMLGHADDDPSVLRRAAVYLDQWKEVMHDDQPTLRVSPAPTRGGDSQPANGVPIDGLQYG